jgi:Sugar (and other) transporter
LRDRHFSRPSDEPVSGIWRLTLGLGAVPAAIIFYLRHDLPETAVWLIRHGRFREAKKVAASLYGDSLDMLPDEDVEIPRPRPTAFLADIRQDPIRWRATLFGWIACFAQSAEFSTSSSSCRHFCRSFFSRCCSRRSARRMRRSSPPFSPGRSTGCDLHPS